jgi:hypothetical protein
MLDRALPDVGATIPRVCLLGTSVALVAVPLLRPVAVG